MMTITSYICHICGAKFDGSDGIAGFNRHKAECRKEIKPESWKCISCGEMVSVHKHGTCIQCWCKQYFELLEKHAHLKGIIERNGLDRPLFLNPPVLPPPSPPASGMSQCLQCGQWYFYSHFCIPLGPTCGTEWK